MKIILDQRGCNCWQPTCDAHFGWHFLRQDINPIDCTVDIVEDGRSELTFLIKDRDGTDKVLVIDDSNRAQAIDSWRLAWEQQNQAAL